MRSKKYGLLAAAMIGVEMGPLRMTSGTQTVAPSPDHAVIRARIAAAIRRRHDRGIRRYFDHCNMVSRWHPKLSREQHNEAAARVFHI